MPSTVSCPHCGHTVEQATFCTNCGQRLTTSGSPASATGPATANVTAPAAGRASSAAEQNGHHRFGLPSSRLGRATRLLPVPVTGSPRIFRWILAIGTLVVLLDLLGGNAGSAIVLASIIVPLLMVAYLYAVDVYEDESRFALLLAGIWGGLVGLGFGALSAWLVGRLWIKHATFHIGAAGFGSRFAADAGFAPISIIFLVGIALPVIAVGLMTIGPLFLRRFPSLRNEAMDGITFGAAVGGGFAIVSTLVYFWPLVKGPVNPGLGIADWTALLIGLVLLRPLILCIVMAFVCAGVWNLHLTQQTRKQRLPIAFGLGLFVVYAVADVLVQSSGARAELIWLVVVTIVAWLAFRTMVPSALAQDQAQLINRNLVVCRHCHKLTAPGAFCEACGKPLSAEPATPAATTGHSTGVNGSAQVAGSATERGNGLDTADHVTESATEVSVPEPQPASGPSASANPSPVPTIIAAPAPAAADDTPSEAASPSSLETATEPAAPDAQSESTVQEPNAPDAAPPAAPSPQFAGTSTSLPWWILESGHPPASKDDDDKKSDPGDQR